VKDSRLASLPYSPQILLQASLFCTCPLVGWLKIAKPATQLAWRLGSMNADCD